MANNDILKKTEDFISNLFREKLSPKHIYHNYKHTLDVVNNTR